MAAIKEKTETVELRIQLPVRLDRKDKWYIASCPALDVFSQGKTEEKAKKNLAEALNAFLISCLERGTLEAVLKQCGFKPAKEARIPKRKLDKDEEYLNIPIPLLAKFKSADYCHA
jgi:predicted RNase H-like HicB family nuclease